MNPASTLRIAALVRFALRDLRGGFEGLRIFLACIAIGVAAIVAVNSLARSLDDGLARDGRTLLGGDAAFSLIHQELSPEERGFFAARGALSDVATARAMARNAAGDATLVDLKAVGSDWPSLGKAVFDPPMTIAEATGRQADVFGAAVDDSLLDKLKLKVGDPFSLGDLKLVVRTRVTSEPDRLGTGLGFGARVLVSMEALHASGLVQPGALIRWTTRVSLGAQNAPPSEPEVAALVAEAKTKFPQAGWEVRSRKNASPDFSRNLDRFGQFLALVGLISLVVGGVGVANAAQGFIERKRASLAILKALGASGAEAVTLALIEFLIVAGVGVAIGLVVGAATPFLVSGLVGVALPYPLAPSIYPRELGLGALFGFVTALAFSIAPLGRAHDLPVSALFRDLIAEDRARPRWRYALMALAAGGALAGLAILASDSKTVAVTVVVGTACGLAALRAVASASMALARIAPRPPFVEGRLALANLHRPGAPTPSVVISLGLGLAVIVTLALVDVNLRDQLHPTADLGTPNFYFLDVRNSEATNFRKFLEGASPGAKIVEAPMMRGRIVAIGDVAAADFRAKESAQWALQGDRGVTFADAPPPGSTILSGKWWDKDYKGPPLISLESDIADGLGLKVGDSLTVNVLGRNITAKIANLRKVNWRSFAINFVLVYSPDTFKGAPYSMLVSAVLDKKAGVADELALMKATTQAFPTISAIRVREALDAIEGLVAKLAEAIRAASGVALATSVLTLAGALAANRRARIADAIILKVLGATRARLMTIFLLEYAALGAGAGLFGVGAGALAAYVIVARVMGMDFQFDWALALGSALAGLLLTVGLGMAGAWRILGLQPAAALRAP
jgi:putative ABC transport system permease protein